MRPADRAAIAQMALITAAVCMVIIIVGFVRA